MLVGIDDQRIPIDALGLYIDGDGAVGRDADPKQAISLRRVSIETS